MIELHKIIRLSHLAACSVVFILLYRRDWQRRVFKVVMNDQFLVFLSSWVLFPNLS